MRLRVARPTQRLPQIVAFYEDGLGLPRLGAFTGHDGYDGVILGVPDERAQVEFTTRPGVPAPHPAEDAHLVLYFTEEASHRSAVERLLRAGHARVEPGNPYWRARGETFVDPDGWEVVLVRPSA